MYYHVIFGRSVSEGVCINRKEPPNLVSAGASSPCDGGGADPLGMRHSPRFPAEFGRSGSNSASIMKEIHLKNLTNRQTDTG